MGTPGDYPGMASAHEAWLRSAVPAGTYRGWVAESDDGTVVGGAGVIVLPWSPGPVVLDPRCAFVFNVYTDPAHRHQGLARRLMETIHAWCQSQGVRRIALNASRDGRPIYEAMGYELAEEPMMRYFL
jgi:GNAT superfamily N-acetyltransferase